ncbi:MAG: cytochrome c [Verrucomicrobia bacterium]|nr:cytochrome c [Verrucomicrobiota bacterium]
MKLNQNTLASLAAFGMLSLGLHANAEEPSPEVMKEGKSAYATCMACHNVDGKGLPVGTLKMAPPLTGSKFAMGDPEVMALAILKGIEKDPSNTAYIGIMAPLETALDDKKLASVMTYVRNSFGNKAAPVTEAQAKGYREKFAKIKSSVKRSTLDKLLEKSEAAAKGTEPAAPGEAAAPAPAASAAPPATE